MRELRIAPPHTLTLVRTISGTPDAVYAAWTDVHLMRRWLGPGVSADARVGGAYSIETEEEDGTVCALTGHYIVLEPGRRILKTFVPGAADANPYVDEFVDVRLRPLGPGLTELSLTNGWWGPDMPACEKDDVRGGWNVWLDPLDRLFGGRTWKPRRGPV